MEKEHLQICATKGGKYLGRRGPSERMYSFAVCAQTGKPGSTPFLHFVMFNAGLIHVLKCPFFGGGKYVPLSTGLADLLYRATTLITLCKICKKK